MLSLAEREASSTHMSLAFSGKDDSDIKAFGKLVNLQRMPTSIPGPRFSCFGQGPIAIAVPRPALTSPNHETSKHPGTYLDTGFASELVSQIDEELRRCAGQLCQVFVCGLQIRFGEVRGRVELRTVSWSLPLVYLDCYTVGCT